MFELQYDSYPTLFKNFSRLIGYRFCVDKSFECSTCTVAESLVFALQIFMVSDMCYPFPFLKYLELTFFTRFNNSQIFPLIYYVLLINFSPKLTWRDVQHIIVRAAKPITSPNHETRWRRDKPSWNRNSAGLLGNRGFFVCIFMLFI